MSDSSDQPLPRDGGPSWDESDGLSELPPETAVGASIDRFRLPALSHGGTRWRKRDFAWLDETLSRKTGAADPFYLKTVLPVTDRLAGIILGGTAALWIAGTGDRTLYLLLGPTVFFQNINAI